MQATLRRILNAQLLKAFVFWRHGSQQRAFMLRMAAKMVNGQLTGAVNKWRSTAAEGKQEERKMKKMLMRMLNGKIARMFSLWRDIAAQAYKSLSRILPDSPILNQHSVVGC